MMQNKPNQELYKNIYLQSDLEMLMNRRTERTNAKYIGSMHGCYNMPKYYICEILSCALYHNHN